MPREDSGESSRGVCIFAFNIRYGEARDSGSNRLICLVLSMINDYARNARLGVYCAVGLFIVSRRTGDCGFRRFGPRPKRQSNRKDAKTQRPSMVFDSVPFSTGSAQGKLVARLGALGQRCER